MPEMKKNSDNGWYIFLNRSPLTPPGYIFGIAWSFLYILIVITGCRISTVHAKNRKLIALYFTNFLINISWYPVFFIHHAVGFSVILIISMISTLSICMLLARKVKDTVIIILNIPYLIWLVFALYLNSYIWLNN